MNYHLGTPENYDPCQFGCPEGYTTSCLGDQQPDSCGCCVDYSPIVIDRAGHPRFSSAEDGVVFAINARGSVLRVAWPLSPSTAFLTFDRNMNGTVDDGSELFGNTTPLIAGGFGANGYVALAEYDWNGDRIIDRNDAIYAVLRIWTDVNRNGISEREELVPLAVYGVEWISVTPESSAKRDRWGNRFAFRSKVSFGSYRRFSYDVFPVALRLDGSAVCAPGTKSGRKNAPGASDVSSGAKHP